MTDIERQAAALPQFCPECGAGLEGTPADGYGALLRLHRTFDPPCPECDRRSAIRMQAAGARTAREQNDAFWQAFLAPDTPHVVQSRP